MRTRTLAIAAIVLWAASAAFIGYKFVAGSTVSGADGREAIVLNAGERDMILGEMRVMLAAVRDIVAAANAGDVAAIQTIATRVGMTEAEQVPPQTVLKLPLPFKQLGFSTHEGFDEVARAAEVGPQAALDILVDNMDKCVACHETYRLAVGE